MNLYEKASLVQIPSGYKASDAKLYSVVPNTTAGDFTVSSDADATRVNKDGLVETTVANQARLNYDFIDGVVQPDPHLLLEPTRTNNQTYSKQFDNSQYFKYNSVSVTANDTTSPDGTLTADKIISDGSQDLVMRTFGNGTVGSVNTFSVWAKKGNFDKLRIDLADSGGQTFTLTDKWQRVSITTTPSNDEADFEMPNASNGDFIYLWGAQIEVGSYPTSYIPTSGSAVTRTNDNVYNGGDSTLFDLDELTFFVDVTPYKGGVFHYASLNGGSNQNRIIFIFRANNASYTARVVSSGSTQLNDNESITFETRNKIAIALKANDAKVFLNGTEVAAYTIFTMPVNLDRLNFSIYANSDNFFQGKVHQVMVFNKRLTDQELITLTS